MKSRKFLSVLAIPLLFSCGGDMRDWPYVNLEFNVEEAKTVFVDYVNRKDRSLSFRCYSSQTDAIVAISDFIESFHIEKNVTSKDVSDYNMKIAVYFVCDDQSVYDFKAYSYNGASNYFMYNDELRKFPADFEGTFLAYIERHSSSFTFFSE